MIFNKTRKTTLSKEFTNCKTPASKARGLMWRIKPKTLIFYFKKEKIVPLHMIFVFFPIDVIYLNSKKQIVDLKNNFKPFTFFTPSKKARYVIELPVNTIKKSKTKLGDKISF